MTEKAEKIVTNNRKASFNFHLLERFEAGIMLTGSEVKSLRDGGANLADAYASIKNGEIFLINAHISPYEPANYLNHQPKRDRKLLLHKKEITKIIIKLKERGLTLIPTKIYFKGGKAKLEIALAKGKKSYDKRASIKERESKLSLAKGRIR